MDRDLPGARCLFIVVMLMPPRRVALVGFAGACLAGSFLLPAMSIFEATLSGAELFREGFSQHWASFLAFSANLMVPALALMRPRLRRCEIALVTIVLAAAAWLTARAVAGPAQLHSGVLLWWLAMLTFGALALESRGSP